MMKTLLALGLVSMAAPSFAYTTGDWAFLDSRAASPNTVSWVHGTPAVTSTYDVSPYSGAFGSSSTETGDSAAKLFCDDFVDHASYNSSWQVTVTQVNESNMSQTRFGSAVPTGNTYSYPTGTTLYQEIAWLFTQSIAAGVNPDDQDTIQEAVWKLTGSANSTPNTTYGDAHPISGSATGWIELAAADYNKTVTGYLTPDYSKWYIVTDKNAAGNTGGSGVQEFLAYKTGTNGLPVSVSPEPATFVLAGAALLGLGYRRRKLTTKK